MLNSIGGASQAGDLNGASGKPGASQRTNALMTAVRSFFARSVETANAVDNLFGNGRPSMPEIRQVSLIPVVPGFSREWFEAASAPKPQQNFDQYFRKSSREDSSEW